MQVTQADSKKVKKGVEEEFIKFRPSPNFKNMKKFLKNRSDYTDTTALANHKEVIAPDPTPSKPSPEKAHLKEVKPVVVQPPLPPYPPPPDSPPNLNVTIKQEKEDDDVQNNPSELGLNIEQKLPKVDKPVTERPREPKKTICKEFIRGICKRPVCRFAHEVDVSQLNGVFTFCWDYQNAVCTFPNCKYVHATIFEEGEFYRTGILPPHIRRQMKQVPPPPPPPEDTQQENIRISNFSNPPPFHPSVEKPMPLITCVPTSNMETRPDDSFRNKLPGSTSPLKREWKEIEKFIGSPCDIEFNGNNHIANKKCKKCDIMEFSEKYNKEMVENIIQSADEVNKKLGQLNKKSNKLLNVLLTLMQPMIRNCSSKSVLSNGLISADKEKSLAEQFGDFVGNNRTASVINDDHLKNFMGSNINLPGWFEKLLRGSGDTAMPTDTSRET